MTYYRFKGKDDLWLGKFASGGKRRNWADYTLIPNELLTQKQIDSLSKECPRLSIDKAFEKLELKPGETYVSFGVRFQDGWDNNGKQENLKRLKIKEKYDAEFAQQLTNSYYNDIQKFIDANFDTFKKICDKCGYRLYDGDTYVRKMDNAVCFDAHEKNGTADIDCLEKSLRKFINKFDFNLFVLPLASDLGCVRVAVHY